MFFINLTQDFDIKFDIGKFMEFTNNVHDILTSHFITNIKNLLGVSGTFVVTGEEFRPDLISWKIYGSTQYWWIIMVFNSILDPDDIVSGTVIEYPLLDNLENFYFDLRALEAVNT